MIPLPTSASMAYSGTALLLRYCISWLGYSTNTVKKDAAVLLQVTKIGLEMRVGEIKCGL
jgi:hypothetical protein